MKTVKDVEDPFVLGGGDSKAVVAHGDVPAAVSSLGGEVHCWRFFAAVLDRVPDQVLNELQQLRGVSRNGRERIGCDDRTRFDDRGVQVRERLDQDLVAVDDLERDRLPLQPRILEQVVDQPLHPFDAVDDELNPFLRLIAQPILVTVSQQLDEASDGEQRFPEIVRHRRNELLQFAVALLQPCADLLQTGNVLDDVGDRDRLIILIGQQKRGAQDGN